MRRIGMMLALAALAGCGGEEDGQEGVCPPGLTIEDRFPSVACEECFKSAVQVCIADGGACEAATRSVAICAQRECRDGKLSGCEPDECSQESSAYYACLLGCPDFTSMCVG